VNAESSKQHDPTKLTSLKWIRGEYLRTKCVPDWRAAPVESPSDAENPSVIKPWSLLHNSVAAVHPVVACSEE
jgi:hypothetical protein